MKCSTHPSDSGIGVCAFCLRERLSALAASPAEYTDVSSPESHRNPDRSSATPPPLRHLSPFSNAAGMFSLLSPIWNPNKKGAAVSKPSGSSNSWLLGLKLGRRKRNKRKSTHVRPVSGRGMSPAEEMSPGRGVPIASPLWRQQSPCRFSSFGLCLSPMVRPIPGNRRGYAPQPETAISGEIRGTFNRRCGGGGVVVQEVSSGLMVSRSRKLVDLGKVW